MLFPKRHKTHIGNIPQSIFHCVYLFVDGHKPFKDSIVGLTLKLYQLVVNLVCEVAGLVVLQFSIYALSKNIYTYFSAILLSGMRMNTIESWAKIGTN